MKHVKADMHFIKKKVEDDTVCITYVSIGDQVADLLTKALAKKIFEKQVDKLGMFNLSSPT